MKAESPENPAEAVTPEEAIERRALARAQEEAREAAAQACASGRRRSAVWLRRPSLCLAQAVRPMR